jgi:hypothetical protein
MLNYSCYAISQMPKYDLDFNSVIVGAARTGKSVLLLQKARRIYASKWNIPLNKVDEALSFMWVKDHIIYDKQNGLIPFKKFKSEVIAVDEAYFVADRRESMQKQQVEYTKNINKYASNNNMGFTLIQDLTDLDSRIYSKANEINLIDQRGSAYLYCRSKRYPIVKDTYQFEKFQKYAYLLMNNSVASSNLRGLPNFIKKIHWQDMQGNILYDAYLEQKKKFQSN